jgi:hypothetical protein
MSGISFTSAATTCEKYYKGDPVKVDVCKAVARSVITRMIQNKAKICKAWCGCP